MKVMILSDSHAMTKDTLLELLRSQKVDAYIHCGDIYMMYDGLPIASFYLARGNNDFGDILPELTITLDTMTFFICHGHRYYVDYGVEQLVQKAKEVQADVVCYGHTHKADLQTMDGMLVINPGSVSYPRGSYRFPTYCILDTQSKQVEFYNVKTKEICNPFTKEDTSLFSFKKFFK